MRRPPNKHTSRDKRFIRLDFLGLRTQIRPHFSREGSLALVLPSKSSRSSKGFGCRAVVSHISHKTSEMPRISCTRPWTKTACAPFFNERGIKLAEPTKLPRKSGDV